MPKTFTPDLHKHTRPVTLDHMLAVNADQPIADRADVVAATEELIEGGFLVRNDDGTINISEREILRMLKHGVLVRTPDGGTAMPADMRFALKLKLERLSRAYKAGKA